MAKKGITPLGDRVLIKPLSEKELNPKNKLGIILPNNEEEKPEQGEVVAVGEGRYENGKLVPVKVKKGDRVVFAKYGGDEIKVNGEVHLILKEDQILALIR